MSAPRTVALSRRQVIGAGGAAGALWWAAGDAATATASLEAYAGATSVKAGATPTFCVRDPAGSMASGKSVPMGIARVGVPDVTVLSSTVTVRNATVPATACSARCGWPATVTNDYGGKNPYTYNSTHGVAATQVSFNRPHGDPIHSAVDPGQAASVRWLAKNRIAAGFCPSIDLRADAAVLQGYQLFLTAGHDEYLTREMRDRLDAMVAAGGNAAIFAGYSCWWQSRLEAADGRPYPTGSDGSPVGLTVLALPDASNLNAQAQALGEPGDKSGYAAIAIGSRGGTAGMIFNGGTIEWPLALQPELDGKTSTPFSRITLNVITLLSVPHRETVDVRQWRNAQANADGSRRHDTTGFEAPAGAVLDRTVFRACTTSVPNTVPIYRYKYPQANGDGYRYPYSQTADLGYGWIADGIAFHAFASALSGTAAVYQHHIAQTNGDGWRMYHTPSLSVAGWTFDDVAFYAPLD